MAHSAISGAAVLLRHPSQEDIEQVEQWDKDPDVSLFRETGDSSDEKGKSISFGIYLKGDSTLIGSIAISSIDSRNGHAELGMAIGDKQQWGKGYGSDAVRVVLGYCFRELGLNKVYLDVWEENERAVRCYLKCGFKKDGVLREHVKKDGEHHNKLMLSILRGEWQEIVQRSASRK
mgnify:CR=1 FL=1